jgi:hypothetical protein
VNFLLHRFLAARDLRSEIAGIGAMLPDLWRMVDRRVRAVPQPIETTDEGDPMALLLAGIQHHLETDRWFHSTAAFVEGEQLTAERLRSASVDVPKLGLFAHVAWELCLDGALVRRQGLEHTLQGLRDGFDVVGREAADAAVSVHHFDRLGRPVQERRAFVRAMEGLLGEITGGRLIAGYQSGPGVARRIDGIRLRLGFAGLSENDRQRIGDVLDGVGPHADAAVETLTASGVAIPTNRRR